MTLNSRIRQLQNKIAKRKIDSKPVFFNSQEEYDAALASGSVRDNHICIINDVPLTDE